MVPIFSLTLWTTQVITSIDVKWALDWKFLLDIWRKCELIKYIGKKQLLQLQVCNYIFRLTFVSYDHLDRQLTSTTQMLHFGFIRNGYVWGNNSFRNMFIFLNSWSTLKGTYLLPEEQILSFLRQSFSVGALCTGKQLGIHKTGFPLCK